ncbi:MAG: histidine kinase dimerization/phospho-acceptor domain-containing protein, partial [Thermodesulfovibrionales bacterium]
MKVQTRITALIFCIVILFLGGITLLWYYQERQESIILQEREKDKKSDLTAIVATKGKTLQALVYDYSFWDDMVRFVKTIDKKWAHDYIDTSLPTYNAQAAWVYRKDFTLAYSFNTLRDKGLHTLPLSRKEMRLLLSGNLFPHYFMHTSQGIMEIWGGPVQPTTDIRRETAPEGYFFAGRIWSREYINDIAKLTGGEIRISAEREGGGEKKHSDVIQFSQPLTGWDNRRVAWVSFYSKDPLLTRFHSSSVLSIILSLAFALSVLGILSIRLSRWVTVPLKKISSSLDKGNTEGIKGLGDEKTEFGHISRLMTQFFQQRQELETAMASIERAKREWEATFDAIPDPIFIHDDEHRIIRANRAFSIAAGLPFTEIINKPYYAIFPRTDGPLEGCKKALQSMEIGEEEMTFETKTYRMRYCPTQDLSGGYRFSIHVVEDITAHKLLQNAEVTIHAMEEANRAKTLFLANMSHELRTPLNSVIGFAEILDEEIPGSLNEQQKKNIGYIIKSGKHLLSIINDILDITRVEAGRDELEISSFCLRESLESALLMFRETAGKHGIDLKLDLEPEVDVIVSADERRLRQIT